MRRDLKVPALTRAQPRPRVYVASTAPSSEGAWIECAEFVYGYNQAQVCFSAYTDPDAFALVPSVPESRKGYSAFVFMVSYSEGVLRGFNESMVNEIKEMASFVSLEFYVKPGEPISKSIDCFTFLGNVKLVHPVEKVVEVSDRAHMHVRGRA